MPPRAGDRVSDIGTGTGIVPMTFCEAAPAFGLTVGCDRSLGMFLRARARVAGLRILIGVAAVLLWRDGSFHLATANFVLSHIGNYPAALAEALPILKPSGMLAVSNWGPPSDPVQLGLERMPGRGYLEAGGRARTG